MSNLDDNHIHQRLERLSKIEPTQEATDRAKQRVRDTIMSEKTVPNRGTGFQPVETRPGWPCHVYSLKAVFQRRLLSSVVKPAVAAVLIIGLAFLAGRLSAPEPLEAEALQATIRQELLDEMENRLQSALASQRESLRRELYQQVGHDMKIFAEQTLRAVGNLTDQRFLEFARMVEAARIKDRQRVAAAFDYVGSRFGDGLVTLATHTSELQRTE